MQIKIICDNGYRLKTIGVRRVSSQISVCSPRKLIRGDTSALTGFSFWKDFLEKKSFINAESGIPD